MKRVFNFNPGPAALPEEALKAAAAEMLDYKGTGMSVLEISHRSKDFEAILAETKSLIKKHLAISDNFHILFMGGGASLQFAMVPMNFLSQGQAADYVITGAWAQKAASEAKLFGTVNVAATSEPDKFTWVPKNDQIKLSPGAQYVHMTSNNTIFGTQLREYPDTGNVPLVVDMSSDIMSKRVDVSRMSFVYAGAQKNMGPAGVTVLLIRDDFLQKQKTGLPKILSYSTYAKEDSLYNTPPVFAIYMTMLTMRWIDSIGGLGEVEKRNKRKYDLLYGQIDGSNGYYRGTVRPDSRSWMNATLRLGSEELEDKFIKEAKAAGFVGLKGHRSVGGVRVSMYNAVSVEAIEKLVEFMKDFQKKN
ncbi:MAG: 3-phosphoserine/phosphohydroxythreonine transaminase [candidate division Zixibacteria bacterium]|nr:3-phosphoserine/phosphohydroxythreonine transaminase [candidate division Zixibacteria bacterium]